MTAERRSKIRFFWFLFLIAIRARSPRECFGRTPDDSYNLCLGEAR